MLAVWDVMWLKATLSASAACMQAPPPLFATAHTLYTLIMRLASVKVNVAKSRMLQRVLDMYRAQ